MLRSIVRWATCCLLLAIVTVGSLICDPATAWADLTVPALSTPVSSPSRFSLPSRSLIGLSNLDLDRLDGVSRAATAAGGRGDFELAERGWTQIIEEMPENAAAWSNRGNIRIGLNQLDAAIDDYTRSIELAPQVTDPYINRGAAYEAQQNWDAAIADYNEAIAIDDQDPAAYNNRGNAQARQGDWENALADYQRAIAIDPKFSLARLNVAFAQYELGRDEQALRELRSLVRKYPSFVDARAALTAAYWQNGQQGQAESNWVAVNGLDQRYQDIDWVENVRRWPPRLVKGLRAFLDLESP